jgi:hypothetical protein
MRISVWFFAALSTLSLLSPPGATHDEWYHAASIWCGHGVRLPYCEEIGDIPNYGVSAVVNLDAVNCKAEPTEPLVCPADRYGKSRPLMNGGLYPPVFYFILSWFVVPSVQASVILVRLVSALILSLLLCLCLWLMPARFRRVLSLVVLTGFSSTGFFLFASINPSSWSSFGIGVGWIPLFAALSSHGLGFIRRLSLGVVGVIGFVMAAGSRWDTIPMMAFVVALGGLYLGWELRSQWRQKILVSIALVPIGLFTILEKYSPFSPLDHLRTLYSYSEDQPNNTLFFSYNLIQALPNALRALGTVPTLSLVVVPKASYVLGLLLLFYVMSRTQAHSSKWQIMGLFSTVIAIASMIMTQVATNDYRDIGSVEPRYVYPLLLFGLGWWFLQASDESLVNISQRSRQIVLVAVGIYVVSTFSITERFVDYQSYGFRLIPEGPDQWWWTGLPVGPNTVLVLSVLSLWRFLTRLVRVADLN